MKSLFLTIFVVAVLFSRAHGELVQWKSSEGGNDHFYGVVVSNVGVTWDVAQAESQAAGGHLATITSPAENSFIFDLVDDSFSLWINSGIDTRGPWLGGFQRSGAAEPNGGWQWVTDEPFGYNNWATNPSDNRFTPNNNGDEDRLHFFGFGNNRISPVWNDLPSDTGDNPRAYVVEFAPRPTAINSNGSFEEFAGSSDGTLAGWQSTDIDLVPIQVCQVSWTKVVSLQIACVLLGPVCTLIGDATAVV